MIRAFRSPGGRLPPSRAEAKRDAHRAILAAMAALRDEQLESARTQVSRAFLHILQIQHLDRVRPRRPAT